MLEDKIDSLTLFIIATTWLSRVVYLGGLYLNNHMKILNNMK